MFCPCPHLSVCFSVCLCIFFPICCLWVSFLYLHLPFCLPILGSLPSSSFCPCQDAPAVRRWRRRKTFHHYVHLHTKDDFRSDQSLTRTLSLIIRRCNVLWTKSKCRCVLPLVMSGDSSTQLLSAKGHVIEPWWYSEESGTLFRHQGGDSEGGLPDRQLPCVSWFGEGEEISSKGGRERGTEKDVSNGSPASRKRAQPLASGQQWWWWGWWEWAGGWRTETGTAQAQREVSLRSETMKPQQDLDMHITLDSFYCHCGELLSPWGLWNNDGGLKCRDCI